MSPKSMMTFGPFGLVSETNKGMRKMDKMMRTVMMGMGLMVGLGIWTTTAAAQLPNGQPDYCLSGRNARQYQTGKQVGANLAQQAWASGSVGQNCDEVDAFRAEVFQVVELSVSSLPDAPSQASMCRAIGQLQGILETVDAIQNECVDVCITDGEFTGEMAAFLYCALSERLGGLGLADDILPLPVGVCGANFTASCTTVFVDVTTTDPLCSPYSADPFVDVWTQTLNNECVYSAVP